MGVTINESKKLHVTMFNIIYFNTIGGGKLTETVNIIHFLCKSWQKNICKLYTDNIFVRILSFFSLNWNSLFLIKE